MATPYRQVRLGSAGSTQDVARDSLGAVPVLVMAAEQSAGRGRTGSEWWNAPRALATSLAFEAGAGDARPFSLMAGVAAVRAVPQLGLKWPNDLMVDDLKAGGILVEVSEPVVVVGMGLNLWWPEPPDDATSLFESDPGPDRHAEIGALWAAELMRVLERDGWPLDEYRGDCSTLGRVVTWEPDGSGLAVDVTPLGSLVVETQGGLVELASGAVRHIR